MKDQLNVGQKSPFTSTELTLDPPPIYRLREDDEPYSQYQNAESDIVPPARISGGLVKPGVVPQVTKTFQGTFFSPFARLWIPALEAHGISRNIFISYIDGLNESFIAHPIFQGVSTLGGVLQMAHGSQSAQLTGMGLQLVAGLASSATSYARTKIYVETTNKDLFHPAGLQVNIMTTEKMLEKIGFPEDQIKLPAFSNGKDDTKQSKHVACSAPQSLPSSSSSRDISGIVGDIQMRRLEALKGYVMPYTMDVPDHVIPDNFLKKLGANQAKRMEQKQNERITKTQSKIRKERTKVEKLESKHQDKVFARDSLAQDLEDKLERQLSILDDESKRKKIMEKHEKDKIKALRKHEREIQKSERDVERSKRKHEKETAKMDKKEDNKANKIRWLVISKWDRNVDSDVDAVVSSSDDE